ncbi:MULTISPECIES: DUF2934 domain-containing protein [Rhizobium]|uniref:DUF2934 domain-containing protein n=1 Tax=Rhizobium tropici TaxID=398 RepID=A0A329Y5D6_RHITR|nr:MULTISPECIES: DUF2934 domain-containing protein [Rhizobium]MBB3285468.1 hypothetical protein [Rhizobium sp. BK252]MBB3400208.1 hypothetical protein [Rhizobium sp. BK289]MBB3412787.1 hypothetical protein [Rhizobium sp. BK284]MBB3480674.1 hypothetical protein [Rhizobium sp. BK347]MDK4719332.1 DUF2934 domain-containing protein [Rhizobium sp. CNPSo 3968]
MLESRDEWIKKRAYAIWEEEGHPFGRDVEHWERASGERIALDESAAIAIGGEAKPKAKRKPTAAAAKVVAKPTAKKASKKAAVAKA